MTEAYTELVKHTMRRRHITAALLAAGLSALLHVGLLVWLLLSPIALPFLKVTRPEPEPSPYEPFRVQDVAAETWEREMRDIMTPPTSESPAIAELAEQVEVLAVPPVDASADPPPVAGDLAEAPPAVEPPRPADLGAPPPWVPRQEVMALSEQLVREVLPEFERVLIPDIARQREAPDVLPPAELTDVEPIGDPQTLNVAGAPGPVDIVSVVSGDGAPPPIAVIPDAVPETGTVIRDAPELLSETPETVSPHQRLEDFLDAEVIRYEPRRGDFGYFRLAIRRAGAEVLPVLPKDIIFVQDCSASMSEQRLYFCRKSLKQMIAMLAPGDRFNVVKFRQKTEVCFPELTENTEANRARAASFVDTMTPQGETDILASIGSVLYFKTDPGRPAIALLITDGRATKGEIDASEIIGEFSEANGGRISVFTFGTLRTANRYLLDLISYCNRGDQRMTEGGRWGIPESLVSLMREVSHPVLTDVSFVFAEEAGPEVYPVQTMNLYSDRPLVLYGRYPRTATHLTFQAKGNAGDATGDMVFHLALDETSDDGKDDIEEAWARQKIYHLIGRYTQTDDPFTLEEVRKTARRYRIRIPYKGRF